MQHKNIWNPFTGMAMGLLGLLSAGPALGEEAWKPAQGPLMTRWAKEVAPEKVLPEYPRPQLVRKDWQSLNGLWDYAIQPKDRLRPEQWSGKILVPFAVESALSGVMKPVGPDNRLWYRRTFTVPAGWREGGKRVLIHFGAVDWEATVFVNDKKVGTHRGGYDPFACDVTDALKPGTGEQELIVSVWDPTDTGNQPRGKQVLKPEGIWYTAVTGIWQTAWMEPVAATSVESLKIVPDLDASGVRVTVHTRGQESAPFRVDLLADPRPEGRILATAEGTAGKEIFLHIDGARLWTPDSPALYGLNVTTGGDSVHSYFGMRKIALGKDEKGITRMMLNNKFVFQYGPLDQGWWPDGLYTAPTDEALRYDVEVTKKLGCNMARKHVKVEPARWYYWCDKLGLLVWQDMPSGDKYIGGNDPDVNRTKESADQFETEWTSIINAFYNHPSVVMWVPFNEGWGQYDTPRIVELTRKTDPTRLVNNASGWTDRGVGDVHDIHAYPGPAAPRAEENRAIVLGEFGGLGLPLEGHTWQAKGNWGYRSFTDPAVLTDAYVKLLTRLHRLIGNPGLSAAVYTQTTDVEIEVNGLLTYDRAVIKMDAERIAAAAKALHTPPPQVRVLVPDGRTRGQQWRYTTEKPQEGWEKPGFDDSSWQQGAAGFGRRGTPGATVRTPWETSDIWIRRSFEVPEGTKLTMPLLSLHHDEDAEVYINGVEVLQAEGYTSDYQELPLSAEAVAAIRPGRNTIAIHCRQTGGGQYIDAGLLDLAPPGR